MSVVLQPGEGLSISVMGNEIRSKATSHDTGGSLWVAEFDLAPSFPGPPPHMHSRTVEFFYVLQGRLRCHLVDNSTELDPGGFFLISPGTLHTFSNPREQSVKFLLVCTPGGLEDYFAGIPALIERYGAPPPQELMKELGERYDNIVPPPPA